MSTYIFLLSFLSTVACTEYTLNSAKDLNQAEGELEDGEIRGRICSPSGDTWLVGATAYVEVDDNHDGQIDRRVEAITDGEGYFTLSGLADGAYTIYVTKGSFSTTYEVELQGSYTLAESSCAVEPPNIAVITGSFDHIEDILQDLQIEHDIYVGEFGGNYQDLLLSSNQLNAYDILFLNCGIDDGWLSSESQIQSNLRAFVEQGGSIYASDWSHSFVESAFPEKIDFFGEDHNYIDAQVGNEGAVTADILDDTMQTVLNDEVASLNYDLSSWVMMTNTAENVEILIQGSVEGVSWETGESEVHQDTPLAVRFTHGEGTLVFTSFHNEHQHTTLDMRALLEEMIFSL